MEHTKADKPNPDPLVVTSAGLMGVKYPLDGDADVDAEAELDRKGDSSSAGEVSAPATAYCFLTSSGHALHFFPKCSAIRVALFALVQPQ